MNGYAKIKFAISTNFDYFTELSGRSFKDCNFVGMPQAKFRSGSGGVFDIFPFEEGQSMEVYCDLATDGGGWIVSFQAKICPQNDA